MIRNRADKYNSRELASLGDNEISAILDRVTEAALSREDNDLLRKRIKLIQSIERKEIDVNDKYLAHYFSKLVNVTNEIVIKENNITRFVSTCNFYLRPGKSIVYNENTSEMKVVDDRDKGIDFSALSSGEKQIVSIFAHIYLQEHSERIIIIDEPELSLSVPWQRRFLTDIIDSGSCDFLLAVTHSPFVYENRLKESTVDLRRLIERE